MPLKTVHIAYQWTLGDYLRAHRYAEKHAHGAALWVRRAMFGAAAAWALWSLFTIGYSSLPASLLFVIAFMIVWRWGLQRWRRELRFQRDESLRQRVEWIFSDEGVEIEIAAGRTVAKWSLFREIVETPEGVLLYPHEGIFWWIPESCFQDQEQLNDFRNLVSAKFG